MHIHRRLIATTAAGLALAAMVPGPAGADHSWGNYHWARIANPFTLVLGDNVDSNWDAYLDEASGDWTESSVLDTTVDTGTVTSLKRCIPPTGRVEVCNATYGRTGWLGVAGVYASENHITKGYVKLNDTYFNTSTYNKPEWRRLVMCQEVGHTFGLGHQDEGFNNGNLGSCMDYTDNPLGPPSNEHPDTHDYGQLETIYGHSDSTITVAASTGQQAAAARAGNSEAEWGRAIRYASDGRPILFEQDLGNGQRLFTFAVWAR